MERQFNNGEFEKLLRDNANQYRMYPSEKVWKGIHSSLHTRRKWYGYTAAIMFLITSSVVSIFIFNDKNAPNELIEQNNVVNNIQEKSPSTSEIKFSPQIKSNKPTNNKRETYFTESYLNSPIPSLDGEPQSTRLNSSDRMHFEENAISDMPLKNDIGNEGQFSIGINSLNHNIDKVKTEQTKNNDAVNEKYITDQNSVDEETEKKINDALSALSSQNVSITAPKKQAKVTALVFFTPTISYRKLTENKKNTNASNTIPAFALNNIVDHKPAMGLEFGIEGRYQVSKKGFFKTGLQFNISRYDIRAYSHPTEIATVALNNGNRVDSLATLTNYRNFSGTSANWLENFYFQIGVPIGAEIILSDKDDFQWGISGTIQPTYVIGDRAYLLSSDYKNYAEFPDLMRRWNISTGVGTFISYSTGRIKWQAGPHVRYQHLSSFVNELSVKENLFAIGLKVGATLNNNKK